jgi:hypothetical protein
MVHTGSGITRSKKEITNEKNCDVAGSINDAVELVVPGYCFPAGFRSDRIHPNQ